MCRSGAGIQPKPASAPSRPTARLMPPRALGVMLDVRADGHAEWLAASERRTDGVPPFAADRCAAPSAPRRIDRLCRRYTAQAQIRRLAAAENTRPGPKHPVPVYETASDNWPADVRAPSCTSPSAPEPPDGQVNTAAAAAILGTSSTLLDKAAERILASRCSAGATGISQGTCISYAEPASHPPNAASRADTCDGPPGRGRRITGHFYCRLGSATRREQGR